MGWSLREEETPGAEHRCRGTRQQGREVSSLQNEEDRDLTCVRHFTKPRHMTVSPQCIPTPPCTTSNLGLLAIVTVHSEQGIQGPQPHGPLRRQEGHRQPLRRQCLWRQPCAQRELQSQTGLGQGTVVELGGWDTAVRQVKEGGRPCGLGQSLHLWPDHLWPGGLGRREKIRLPGKGSGSFVGAAQCSVWAARHSPGPGGQLGHGAGKRRLQPHPCNWATRAIHKGNKGWTQEPLKVTELPLSEHVR